VIYWKEMSSVWITLCLPQRQQLNTFTGEGDLFFTSVILSTYITVQQSFLLPEGNHLSLCVWWSWS
jgi:hypothetical protein